jgi:hypothetical protein
MNKWQINEHSVPRMQLFLLQRQSRDLDWAHLQFSFVTLLCLNRKMATKYRQEEGELAATKKWRDLICVCPCIVDVCGEEKPTRCHLMIYCSYELLYVHCTLCTVIVIDTLLTLITIPTAHSMTYTNTRSPTPWTTHITHPIRPTRFNRFRTQDNTTLKCHRTHLKTLTLIFISPSLQHHAPYIRTGIVSGSWWWAYKCPKHVEQITRTINHWVTSSWFSSPHINREISTKSGQNSKTNLGRKQQQILDSRQGMSD